MIVHSLVEVQDHMRMIILKLKKKRMQMTVGLEKGNVSQNWIECGATYVLFKIKLLIRTT